MIPLQRVKQTRVGTLESHDGLLEVADDKRGYPGLLDLPQQVELKRVRVLELVHDEAVNTIGKGGQHLWPLREESARCGDHVGVVHEAGLSLDPVVLRDNVLGRSQQCACMLLGVLHRAHMILQCVGRFSHLASEINVLLGQRHAAVGDPQIPKRFPQIPVGLERACRRRPN